MAGCSNAPNRLGLCTGIFMMPCVLPCTGMQPPTPKKQEATGDEASSTEALHERPLNISRATSAFHGAIGLQPPSESPTAPKSRDRPASSPAHAQSTPTGPTPSAMYGETSVSTVATAAQQGKPESPGQADSGPSPSAGQPGSGDIGKGRAGAVGAASSPAAKAQQTPASASPQARGSPSRQRQASPSRQQPSSRFVPMLCTP